MRPSAILVLLLAAGLLPAASALDGHRFTVVFSAEGRALDRDEAVFASGRLELPAIAKAYGFRAAACTVAKGRGRALEFQATLTSAEHGELAIAGTVTPTATAAAIAGTRTWSKPGKQPIVHEFSGAEQPAGRSGRR